MDIKAATVNGLKSACSIFLQDLEALPEEAFCATFGKATRTVADIVYEVNLVNDHIGMVIRGEEPFEWPDGMWIKAPEDFKTKETVVNAFKLSSEKIIATAESFSDEDLEGTVETEHGPRTRFERCRFMGVHLWYHSGQLNFIQTILGDTEWHWK
jgi:uncharacterized damage-inducible protein DinB